MSAAMEGHTPVVELLIEKGATVNAGTETGVTALMHAAEGGYTPVVELLIEKGATVNAGTESGFTALMSARQKTS